MVRYFGYLISYLIFIFQALPLFLFSGEFIASVNRNEVDLGESFTLNLTLKDASTKGAPSIDPLKKSFIIHAQQQSQNTVIINGKISSNITWKFTLMPQKTGETLIPSISINTSEGMLSSEPITIQVVRGSADNGTDSNATSGVTLTTYVDNAKPYKNEPIFYTVRLISKHQLVNIKMDKINLEDAVVEMNGEPKVYEKVVDGMSVGVVEFGYIITPLKTGTLKIPSAVVQGEIPIRRKIHTGSFFDDDFDLFSMMQGFNQLKPLALATEETTVEVQPPMAEISPWLPAASLKIEEIWNESQHLQEGEPITRGLKIIAEGVQSHQLPNLNDLQHNDKQFKIYADKPEVADEVKDGHIKSYRTEQYTLIPQQSGELRLPEISIAWWDVKNKRKVISSIPARTLHVLPAFEMTQDGKPAPDIEKIAGDLQPQPPAEQKASHLIPAFIALIGGLTVLLFLVIFWVISLQKKIRRSARNSAEIPSEKKYPEHDAKPIRGNKKEKLPDLNPT